MDVEEIFMASTPSVTDASTGIPLVPGTESPVGSSLPWTTTKRWRRPVAVFGAS
jgi:hypothetical protein